MKNNIKVSKLGCILSSIAVIISLVNIIICKIYETPLGSSLVIFICMVTIFCANISIYQSKKKKIKKS